VPIDVAQLAIALLFPVGLLALLVSVTAAHRGRTREQIVGGLSVIVACVVGAVTTGMWLRATRDAPLVDFTAGSLALGTLGARDAVGILASVALLCGALLAVRWLTRADPKSRPPHCGSSADQDPS